MTWRRAIVAADFLQPALAGSLTMKHSDFAIGLEFWMSGARWRCTDVGTRVVIAIKLDHPDDESWYNGPPYALQETVINEYDLPACSREPSARDV